MFDRGARRSLARYGYRQNRNHMGSYREPFCFVSTMFLSAVSTVKEPNGTCQRLSKSAHRKEANASLSLAEKLESYTHLHH